MINPSLTGPLLVCLLGMSPVSAEVTGAWSQEPQYVRDWLSRQVSPNGTSCCGLGEAVNVEVLGEDGDFIRLRVTNPRGTGLKIGDLLSVQSSLQVPENYDPEGNPVAWVSEGGYVYCLSILEGQ